MNYEYKIEQTKQLSSPYELKSVQVRLYFLCIPILLGNRKINLIKNISTIGICLNAVQISIDYGLL